MISKFGNEGKIKIQMRTRDNNLLTMTKNINFNDVNSSDLSSITERLANEHLEDYKQDRLMRKEYADKIFKLLCFYMSIVGVLVLLLGFSFCEILRYSDSVLISIITTMTANVIGIFIIVVR